VHGHGIPFFNPYHGHTTTLANIERALEAGAKAVGLSVDLKDGPVNESRLPEILNRSPLPVIVKGILSADNARRAVDSGAKGIVLSNRGGRILENLPAGIEVLPEIREAVSGSALVVLDGGIRSGEDVFKAIALGAHLVCIGRPLFIHCAGASAEGVSYCLSRIRNELREAMLITGAKTVSDIKPHMVHILPR
jgi:isopentenyl diphosphate isomerase/L-lactate dehydrogenase-like FMN-dependent dehydrogenase